MTIEVVVRTGHDTMLDARVAVYMRMAREDIQISAVAVVDRVPPTSK
ncbi:hypothetical protein [Bosea sp. TAF32]